MNVDIQWFFEIFMAGFMTVWSFRYFSGSKEKYSEFEWFALSAFWGIVIIGLIPLFPNSQETKDLINNPFETGFTFSFVGLFIGYAGSRIARMKKFKSLMVFLGKGGQDQSEELSFRKK